MPGTLGRTEYYDEAGTLLFTDAWTYRSLFKVGQGLTANYDRYTVLASTLEDGNQLVTVRKVAEGSPPVSHDRLTMEVTMTEAPTVQAQAQVQSQVQSQAQSQAQVQSAAAPRVLRATHESPDVPPAGMGVESWLDFQVKSYRFFTDEPAEARKLKPLEQYYDHGMVNVFRYDPDWVQWMIANGIEFWLFTRAYQRQRLGYSSPPLTVLVPGHRLFQSQEAT